MSNIESLEEFKMPEAWLILCKHNKLSKLKDTVYVYELMKELDHSMHMETIEDLKELIPGYFKSNTPPRLDLIFRFESLDPQVMHVTVGVNRAKKDNIMIFHPITEFVLHKIKNNVQL